MPERISRNLAERGVMISSGLLAESMRARTKGALRSAIGATIGVLGCPIDGVYPMENKRTFEQTELRGAIISEFPIETSPAPKNSRFGTASLLACARGCGHGWRAVLCFLDHRAAGHRVRGIRRSGAVTQPSSFGMNYLIKRGAKLVTGWEDVVEELPTQVGAKRMPVESASHKERSARAKGQSVTD